ncbi:hypothetical protein C8R44DRAFT_874735 [Mycena epipterygia]|nr:hypothetical protein C8R44DRAFT_874735 [Mycena epipterygia]
MSLNTMSFPVRHPWFDKPSLKRKHPAEDPSCPTPKRRRANTLERGFASLSLDAVMHAVDAPIIPVVEEPPLPRPVTPTIPEITMKTSSWYEPEPDRIVITDLNSYSDDEQDADADTDTLLISPALIERLKTRPRESTLPVHPQPPTQALVLFRPLSSQIPPSPPPKFDKDDDSDAMDVEP